MTASIPEPRQLRWYQHEAVDSVYTAWESDPLARPGVVLPTGTGKEQPVTTPVPTPYGIRLLGDLQVGDEVLTGSGRPTAVVAIHPQGVKRVFSVRFSDDTFALCGKNHQWVVSDYSALPAVVSRTPEPRKNFLVRTGALKDMIASGRTLAIPRHGVALTRGKPLSDPEGMAGRLYREVLTDPSSPGLFDPTTFIAPEVDRRVVLEALTTTLGEASAERLIPEWVRAAAGALRSSSRLVEQRHLFIPAGVKDFSDHVSRLAWSLGGTARWLSTGEVKGRKSRIPPTDIDRILVVEYPVKGASPDVLTSRSDRVITGVVQGDREECLCITVAHPSGTYLTGYEHIVTHNSTVIAKIAADSRAQGKRVVMLAHREELLQQMADAVKAVDPSRPRPGIVAGELDEPDADIVSASFPTLVKPARLASLGRRDVVITDEAHHINADTYLQVMYRLGALLPGPGNPDFPGFTAPGVPAASSMEANTWARTVGLTATMSRADGKCLGDVWSHIVYEKQVSWAIENDFLVRPRGKVVRIDGLNQLAAVKNKYTPGDVPDFRLGELGEVMAASVDSTVDAVMRHVGPGTGRAPIIFAVTVDHAELIASKLNAYGFRTAAITGRMTPKVRKPIYADFSAGNLDALVTVAVLTEGADFPRCDSVVMARPTRSTNLYTQMIGRALRLFPGKTDALVLDLTGTSRDLSMVSVADIYPPAQMEVVDVFGDPVDPDSEPEGVTGGRAPAKPERIGILEVEDIDLLADRRVNWLRTSTGVRFLDVHTGLLFVWPATTSADQKCYTGYVSKKSRGWEWFAGPDGGPLEMTTNEAVELAEFHADKSSHRLPANGPTRKRNEAPSDEQVNYATRLGIPDAGRKTKARLSDDISIAIAETLLPPSPVREAASV